MVAAAALVLLTAFTLYDILKLGGGLSRAQANLRSRTARMLRIQNLMTLEKPMNTLNGLCSANRVLLLLALLHGPIGRALAQDSETASSPEGMTMLVLFLGVAGIIGVFVLRWSQSTGDERRRGLNARGAAERGMTKLKLGEAERDGEEEAL